MTQASTAQSISTPHPSCRLHNVVRRVDIVLGWFQSKTCCAPSGLRKHEGITTGWNHSTFFFGQALRMRSPYCEDEVSDPHGEEALLSAVSNHECPEPSFETRPRGRSSG